MRGHPRPHAEDAVSSGEKFTLEVYDLAFVPWSHLAGREWENGCIIDDTPLPDQYNVTTDPDSPRIGDLGGCSLSSREFPRPENIRLLGPW